MTAFDDLLSIAVRQASAEQLNAALALRGWKLAYDSEAKQGDVSHAPGLLLTDAENDRESLSLLEMNLTLEDRVARLERITLGLDR